MNDKSKEEAVRRAKLLKSRAERLPDIKKQFEENQKRNFNANFAPGGKDEKLVAKSRKTGKNAPKASKKASNGKKAAKNSSKGKNNASATEKRNDVKLLVNTRKGEMVHHQRMLSQDVNAQATQHIVGIPVNKSRYNGFKGTQLTLSQIRSARPSKDAVRIIPIGGLGEFVLRYKCVADVVFCYNLCHIKIMLVDFLIINNLRRFCYSTKSYNIFLH